MPSTPKTSHVDDNPAVPTRELSNKQRRKLSKREQAAYSLEMVEVRRKERRRRTIRRRITAAVAIVAAVAVVGTGSGLIVWANIRAGEVGPANMLSDGILLTGSTDSSTNKATLTPVTTEALQPDAKPVATDLTTYSSTANIALYLDYASPTTAKFFSTNGPSIESWLAAGYITLEVHPIAATATAKNDYSTRAANALACVADTDPNDFLTVSDALINAASKTKETSKTNAALTAIVTKAGITDATVLGCISGLKYGSWVTAATRRATDGGLLNSNQKSLKTPVLVVVNKKAYTGKLTDSTALGEFISSTYSDTSTGTGSPTATPTP